MDDKRKRKYDRIVNGSLAVMMLVNIGTAAVAVGWRDRYNALRAEVRHNLINSCPPSLMRPGTLTRKST